MPQVICETFARVLESDQVPLVIKLIIERWYELLLRGTLLDLRTKLRR